jgi:transcriptional regulator with XRE-family HTH domain
MDTNEIINKWLAWKSSHSGERYTQKRLGIEAGVAQSTLSHIINGKSEPDQSTLKKIVDALGITMADFWLGPDVYERVKKYGIAAHNYTADSRIDIIDLGATEVTKLRINNLIQDLDYDTLDIVHKTIKALVRALEEKPG